MCSVHRPDQHQYISYSTTMVPVSHPYTLTDNGCIKKLWHSASHTHIEWIRSTTTMMSVCTLSLVREKSCHTNWLFHSLTWQHTQSSEKECVCVRINHTEYHNQPNMYAPCVIAILTYAYWHTLSLSHTSSSEQPPRSWTGTGNESPVLGMRRRLAFLVASW